MTYGAAAAFYPGVLEEVSREVGGNVFILPSSTEEVLALRADDPREYRELERMVREVNRTTVRPSERLSDHVYHFDAESRTFERADAYYTRQMIQQRTRNPEGKGERVPAAERTDGSGKLPKAEQTHHWESRERER